jgi:hypothetical protein
MCKALKILALLLSAFISLVFGAPPVLAAHIAADAAAPAPKSNTAGALSPTAGQTAAVPTANAQDIVGTWQGRLKIDANTALTVQFTFARKSDGGWSATLNSPDSGAIKNVSANEVSVHNGAVKVDVAALSGSFNGALKGHNIEGQWTQPGAALPLVLSPYEKPQISRTDREVLSGSWHGALKIPQGAFTFVVRFKPADTGELQGSLAVLEQGATEVPLSDIEFANGTLAFKVPLARGEYTGSYANGTFTGAWKQPGVGNPQQGLPLALQKGEIAPPVYALKLSPAAFAALSGDWEGSMQITTAQGGKTTLPLVVHFGTNGNADAVGSIDSPNQHAGGIPITEATVSAGKVVFKAAALNAEYHGDVSGNTLTGQWTQGLNTIPLTLKRK